MNKELSIAASTHDKVCEFYNQLDQETRAHLFYMLKEIRFNKIKDPRKANRWLGFIHGQLVALTDCTIDELRDICK